MHPAPGGAGLWPLPALAVWALGWVAFVALRFFGAPLWVAIATGVVLGALLGSSSVLGTTPWRRVFVAGGFPLSLGAMSLGASGFAAGLPAWGWLLPLGLLVMLYPLDAWRDAPVFPTPVGALDGLAARVPLPAGARVLDAGCGLGDGLLALRRAYPAAALHGFEWSWPLRLVCGWRCRFAAVTRADIWAADWSAFEMVYVFQRPESMDRAAEKAMREMRPGTWLASLAFEAPGFTPTHTLGEPGNRRVWLYRVPLRATPALR